MLKLLPVLFTSLLVGIFSCQKHQTNDPLAERIQLKNAKEDFQLFQKIIEKAHPALTEYISTFRKNEIFDSVYKTINDDITLRAFYNKLSFLTTELGCSHTFTSLPAEVIDSLQNKPQFFPVPLILINGDLYANSGHELAPGTKILSINNINSKNLLDSISQFHSVEGYHRETQHYLAAGDFALDYYARFGGRKKFELLIKDTAGNIQNLFLNAVGLSTWNLRNNNLSYFDAMDVSYSLTISDKSRYALIRLPSFELETTNQQYAFEGFLKNSFELLSKKPEIKNLIIDLRENTGGDLRNCFLFYSYLAKKPFYEYEAVVSHISEVPYEDYLTLASFEKSKHLNRTLDTGFIKKNDAWYNLAPKSIDYWTPNKYAFRGQVYIITNSKVMSAASYFTLLCRHDGAKIVGVETGGGEYSGNGFSMLEYTLPNTKIMFGFPYVQLKYTYAGIKTAGGSSRTIRYPIHILLLKKIWINNLTLSQTACSEKTNSFDHLFTFGNP